jgi:hypothetical protein
VRKAKAIAAKPTATHPNTLVVPVKEGVTQEVVVARCAADACVTSAATVSSYSWGNFGEASLTELVSILRAQATAVHGGDLREAESTLAAQGTALNSIFAELARRAALNMNQNLPATEVYMKLALRAQNQSRMTYETLATIKNPPVVFAKQANIANNQQVNNGEASPRAHETQNPQTELSRLSHDRQSLDIGTSTQTGRSNPAMATVEAVDRPAHKGRKGNVKP